LNGAAPEKKLDITPFVAAFTIPRTGVDSFIISQIKEGDVISSVVAARGARGFWSDARVIECGLL
jgi:hypothetical protein